MFRRRAALAGLLEDKKKCKMIRDERCVMCEGAGGNVEHLLEVCREFGNDRWYELSIIVGTGEQLEENGRMCKESKVALLWGKTWRELVTQ